MGTSFTLFRVGGIDVRIHWSFVLILIWGAVSYSFGGANPLWGALYGVLVIVLLFVCVTLHEFGHAVAARRYGIGVPHITLLPIGGVAQLERNPEKPGQDLVVSLAGPLVNVVLALVLYPLALLVGSLTGVAAAGWNPYAWMARSAQMGPANLLYYLAAVNLLLALFNLIPAFPMDGGRILRALLAMKMPMVRATRIAVFIGRLVAVPMAIYGIVDGNVLMLLIAFFVYVGGGAEREAVESRNILGKVKVRNALNRAEERLYTSESIQRAVELIMSSYQSDYPVFDLGNRYVGILTRARLVEVLRTRGNEVRVVDAMIPADEVPVLPPTGTLADVWEVMAEGGARVVAIKDGYEFLGLISAADIAEVVNVMGAALEHGSPVPPLPPAIAQDRNAGSGEERANARGVVTPQAERPPDESLSH